MQDPTFDILKIQEEVLVLLDEYSKRDPIFRFSMRRSNRADKLAQGYWFHGNEDYLAVSFWSGMDWKNRTPNIIFVILNTGKTYLEVNMSDSKLKKEFVETFLVKPMQLVGDKHRYVKVYNNLGNGYIKSLKHFVLAGKPSEKEKIDRIIERGSSFFENKREEEIGFIAGDDFYEQRLKVEMYREKLKSAIYLFDNDDKPEKLKRISIQNYGPIKNITIDDIPFKNHWIFLTGENGTGKSSILRAITSAVCFRKYTKDEVTSGNVFQVDLAFYKRDESLWFLNRVANQSTVNQFAFLKGFAAYGQSRLKVLHSGIKPGKVREVKKQITNYSSLFNDDSYLLDLQREMDIWNRDSKIKPLFEKRKKYIIELLTEVIPNLNNILFDDFIGEIPVTSYVESDRDGKELKKVTYDRLSSGLKSLVAMIGDILIRFYAQQPNEPDPSRFSGVIIIDEIDVHLHPKFQKILVEQLTEAFPLIQFIVTTHSPIPLLGAPLNTLIYTVHRSNETGVEIRRYDDKVMFSRIMPNALLNSPIFGLEDITADAKADNETIITKDNFEEAALYEKLEKDVSEFLTDKKQKELVKLFSSKDEADNKEL